MLSRTLLTRTALALVLPAVALALWTPPAAAQSITEERKLVARDTFFGFNADFGGSVAIFGTTAIVGAPGDDEGGNSAGSAFLIDVTDPQNPIQLFKLTASDAAVGDQFGARVAISGTTAIVGARLNDDGGSNSGSAYLFDTTTGQQLFKLTASDAASGDRFGTSVAISGTTAIVGAPEDDDAGVSSNSGSAYLFDTTTGQQLFKLTASDAARLDEFGTSVAISGTTAIVGAPEDDDGGSNSGSAYLFDTTTGQQLFKLTASDAATGDIFGTSVAISGTTAIIGATGDDDGGSRSGSAYLFDTTTGQQLFKLTASDAGVDDEFGIAVAISGTTAIVGAWRDENPLIFHITTIRNGSAYLFDTTTGQQLFKLTGPNDSGFLAEFGASVAISGSLALVGSRILDSAYLYDTTIGQELNQLTPPDASTSGDEFGASVGASDAMTIVGAAQDDSRGSNSGAAYLLDTLAFDTFSGFQRFKIRAGDGAAGDAFGTAVAISGTTAIVGAPFDDDDGTSSGSAYLFDTATGWQIMKLTASDAAPGDEFGASVAISGTTAIVGASRDDDAGSNSGSAYLFDTTTGQQLFKLTASDATMGDRFGIAVAISGSTAILGAREDGNANGISAGSAYLFDTTTGQELFKLTASDGAASDDFGSAVAISGTMAIVGAFLDDDAGSQSGSAYIFDTTTGQEMHKLTASDAEAGDRFGWSVGISGRTAIIGAVWDDDGGPQSGSAYLFDAITGKERFKFAASDAAADDAFGTSVAVSGLNAVVGASGDDYNSAVTGVDQENAGAAYVFNARNCAADWNLDRTINILDIVAFINTWSVAGMGADFDDNGGVNILDVVAFINAWNAGCP